MDAWRERIVEEAKTWLLTPWQHNQCVKGAGVDCGRYLHAVYFNAGLVEDVDFGRYPQDWALNRDDPVFIGWVEKFLDPVDQALPGDVVMWRYGKSFSHGGIVVEWPLLLHAHLREGNVCYGDGLKGELARVHLPEGGSAPREARFYSIAKRL